MIAFIGFSKENNRLIKDGVKVVIGRAGERILTLLNVFLSYHILGLEKFGIFILMLSVVNFAVVIGTFSLPNLVYKKSASPQDLRSTLGNVLFLSILISIACYASLYIGSSWLDQVFFKSQQVGLFRFLGIVIIPKALVNVLIAVLVSLGKIKSSILLRPIGQLIRFLGLTVFWVTDFGDIQSVVILTAISSFFSLLLGVLLVSGYIPTRMLNLVKGELKSIVKVSASFFISTIGVFLVLNLDKLMLGAFSKAADVGYYTLASSLAGSMLLIHGSFATLFKPLAASLVRVDDKVKLQKTYRTITLWVLIFNGFLLLTLTLLSDLLAVNFFDLENEASFAWTLLLLCFNMFVYSSIGPSSSLLLMSGKHRLELANVITYLVINLVLNIVLIPGYGAVGAAMATFFAGSIRAVIHYFEIKGEVEISIIGNFQLLAVLTIMTLLAILTDFTRI